MRLSNLHNSRGIGVINEADTGTPLDPTRYPTVSRHKEARFEPEDVERHLMELLAIKDRFPPGINPQNYKEALGAYRELQSAFSTAINLLQRNPTSGLRGGREWKKASQRIIKANLIRKELGKGSGKSPYIVIAADIDDMKYLNDKTGLGHEGVNSILQEVGGLFKNAFSSVPNAKLFHPHGDEFGVTIYVGDMPPEKARAIFQQAVAATISVGNQLASTGFYLPGWVDERRVQPTISFGVSNSPAAADAIMLHVKTGASGGKPMKYALTIDRDLRYELELTSEEMNAYIAQAKAAAPESFAVQAVDPPEVAMHEGKLPMENVRGKQGMVVLECSFEEIPSHRKKELDRIRRQKIAYLDAPAGAVKVGGRYVPLKEPRKPSQ